MSAVVKYLFGSVAWIKKEWLLFRLTDDVRNHVLDGETTLFFKISALTKMDVIDKAPVSDVRSVW